MKLGLSAKPRSNSAMDSSCRRLKSKTNPSWARAGGTRGSRRTAAFRQLEGAIERCRIEIIAIERFEISVAVSPGEHHSGARVVRVDRQGLFEQTPRVVKRRFRASGQV